MFTEGSRELVKVLEITRPWGLSTWRGIESEVEYTLCLGPQYSSPLIAGDGLRVSSEGVSFFFKENRCRKDDLLLISGAGIS